MWLKSCFDDIYSDSSQSAPAGGEHLWDHMGDYPTNERRSCELRATGSSGTRVRIQTGSIHTHTHTHTGHVRTVLRAPVSLYFRASLQLFDSFLFLCVQLLGGYITTSHKLAHRRVKHTHRHSSPHTHTHYIFSALRDTAFWNWR